MKSFAYSLATVILMPALSTIAAATHEDRLAGLGQFQSLCVPTHVGVFGDVTTVTLKKQGIVYRRGTGAWAKVPAELNGPHSIAPLPNGHWLISDTDNNRMLEIESLSGEGKTVVRTELGGFKLKRPHDQLVDPITGYIYVVDGNRRLFRFKDLQGAVDTWEFPPEQMGYDRALSWFDDRLHVIDSSRGEVMRIDDFTQRRFTIWHSPRPKDPRAKPFSEYGDFPAGSLATTGLVLNDVEKADGWYFGSNFFTRDLAFGGDTRPARLIRWRTWTDFEQGHWEDLSAFIPQAPVPLTPYFLTIHNGILYTGLFDHDEPSFGPTDLSNPCRYDQLLQLDLTSFDAPSQFAPQKSPSAGFRRHPPIDSAPNFRDLGGYKTRDGKTIKWGVLYRSDALNALTPHDQHMLDRLNIAKIVDFRTPIEIARNPDNLPADIANRINLPVGGKAARQGQSASAASGERTAADAKPSLEAINRYLLTLYPDFVRQFTPQYRIWIHGLLDTPDAAQVFHCTGGADRTGFAAAIFLTALGVPRETIMSDYLLTNDLLFSPEGRIYLDERLLTPLPTGLRLYPRYLEAAFAAMETDYGSVDEYLRKALEINDDFRRQLRDRYLE